MSKGVTNYGTIRTDPESLTGSYKAPEEVLGICRGSPWLVCFYFVLYLSFLLFGALVFSTIEAPGELQLRHRMFELRHAFLTQFPCVQDSQLEELIREIVRASNLGVSAEKNATGEPNWSFGQSFFFSSTVVTTIGYGHVTPLSRGGKVFCILYAAVGIPLTLVLLTALVDRLLGPTSLLLSWMNSRLSHIYQPFTVRIFHLCLIVSILGGLFLLIPAAIFASIEPEWNYLDAFYYCFISLTTIGLGDYIPGDSPNQHYRPLYKVLTTIYLFMGITFMMLTLTVFYDIPQLNIGVILSSDSMNEEKVKLTCPTDECKYGGFTTRHVRVRSRRDDDSPSPRSSPVEQAPALSLSRGSQTIQETGSQTITTDVTRGSQTGSTHLPVPLAGSGSGSITKKGSIEKAGSMSRRSTTAAEISPDYPFTQEETTTALTRPSQSSQTPSQAAAAARASQSSQTKSPPYESPTYESPTYGTLSRGSTHSASEFMTEETEEEDEDDEDEEDESEEETKK